MSLVHDCAGFLIFFRPFCKSRRIGPLGEVDSFGLSLLKILNLFSGTLSKSSVQSLRRGLSFVSNCREAFEVIGGWAQAKNNGSFWMWFGGFFSCYIYGHFLKSGGNIFKNKDFSVTLAKSAVQGWQRGLMLVGKDFGLFFRHPGHKWRMGLVEGVGGF